MHDKRLIDANALINVLHAKLCSIDNGRIMRQAAIPVADGMRIMELEYCIGLIQCADIIDAVPVVRCRECVFRGQHDLCPMNVRVYMLDEAAYLDCTEDDGFCHKGEKMDGGATDGV